MPWLCFFFLFCLDVLFSSCSNFKSGHSVSLVLTEILQLVSTAIPHMHSVCLSLWGLKLRLWKNTQSFACSFGPCVYKMCGTSEGCECCINRWLSPGTHMSRTTMQPTAVFTILPFTKHTHTHRHKHIRIWLIFVSVLNWSDKEKAHLINRQTEAGRIFLN